MKQFPLFALRDDLLSVLDLVEQRESIHYARMGGQFANPKVEEFDRAIDIPRLGEVVADSGAASEISFLVGFSGCPVRVRPLKIGDGTTRYFVDQLWNPDTVVFTPGGKRDLGVVISGRIATASDSEASQSLMKIFGQVLRKRFRKIKAYFVGPSALAMLHAGSRLTISAQSAPEFDLTDS